MPRGNAALSYRIDKSFELAVMRAAICAPSAVERAEISGAQKRLHSIAHNLSRPTSERLPPMPSNTSGCLGITEEAPMSVTVTSKGQVTVPKKVRDRLSIKPGSKVDFEVAEDGRAFLRRVGKRIVKPSRFERMRGTATSGLTTDAIMALTRGESR
jgi:antitoxin PrlF